jgi:ribonuclease HI
MSKKTRNRFYAFETDEDRGVVSSWDACERKVSGRRARFRGFPDRASAERWLDGGEDVARRSGPRKVYAYRLEDEEGIVESWDACERKVVGRKARYRGFADRKVAAEWLARGAPYRDRPAEKAEALLDYPEDAVFFDSGTGAGRGVEVNVTDRDGIPLIHLIDDLPPATTLTEDGTLVLGPGRSNNSGELLGCRLAIAVARILDARAVYGDSRLVLDFWSKGHVSRTVRAEDPDLAALAHETALARAELERAGGSLAYVPGDINPADLGYHRE